MQCNTLQCNTIILTYIYHKYINNGTCMTRWYSKFDGITDESGVCTR
jgi:hypothetical protein